MKPVHLSYEAARDLQDIWLYLAKSSIAAADRMNSLLISKCFLLGEFPQLTPIHNEIVDGIRVYEVKDYIIFYWDLPDRVENISHYQPLLRHCDSLSDSILQNEMRGKKMNLPLKPELVELFMENIV